VDVFVRAFPERINSGVKNHPQCGWHHPIDWGSMEYKEKKERAPWHRHSAFLLSVYYEIRNFALPHSPHYDGLKCKQNKSSSLKLFLSQQLKVWLTH
jgi:hypothetical protein